MTEKVGEKESIGGATGGIPSVVFEQSGAGVVTGLSCRQGKEPLLISYSVGRDVITISDQEEPRLNFTARVSARFNYQTDQRERLLRFDAYTYGYKGDSATRHPDLYATKLALKAAEVLNFDVLFAYMHICAGPRSEFFRFWDAYKQIRNADPEYQNTRDKAGLMRAFESNRQGDGVGTHSGQNLTQEEVALIGKVMFNYTWHGNVAGKLDLEISKITIYDVHVYVEFRRKRGK